MKDLTEQITREFAIEQRSAGQTIRAGDIPISYEAITAQWLTHVLCKAHSGAQVISHRLDVPDDGNSNRRRIFIEYNAEGTAALLPTSVFCKASQKLPNRLVLANCHLLQGEVEFYNKYRPMLNIEAPKSYLATYSTQTYNSIIVLEDLGREGAEFCKHTTDVTRHRAESQLNLLARLHGQYYDRPEVIDSDLLTFEDVFNNNDGWFGLKSCCEAGFATAEAVIPPRLFRRSSEIWPATLKSAQLHASLPRTFTHNDPHLRNWYIAKNGEMGSCDFQTLARGHWGRDVAYTISTALTVERRRLWERELLQFYLEKLHAAGGPSVDFADAWMYYRKHLLTSLAWWTLTIAASSGNSDVPPPDFQPHDAALTFIHRMTTAIDDLEALDSFV
jgi:Phosphotransferase enzyme family